MNTVMAHMIPFFPNASESEAVARGLIAGGVSYLEVQMPFSDPTADGPVIQAACAHALENGFRMEAGFRFVERLTAETAVPVFIMSYAGPVSRIGVDEFCRRSEDAGARGVIVPDLPVDSDEGLYQAATRHRLAPVPVIAFGASERRLAVIAEAATEFVYAALRRGVTGGNTTIDEETRRFLGALPAGAKVLGGFGIRRPHQVAAVAPLVHAVVVGSAFVDAVGDGDDIGDDAVYRRVMDLARALVSGAEPEAGD